MPYSLICVLQFHDIFLSLSLSGMPSSKIGDCISLITYIISLPVLRGLAAVFSLTENDSYPFSA